MLLQVIKQKSINSIIFAVSWTKGRVLIQSFCVGRSTAVHSYPRFTTSRLQTEVSTPSTLSWGKFADVFFACGDVIVVCLVLSLANQNVLKNLGALTGWSFGIDQLFCCLLLNLWLSFKNKPTLERKCKVFRVWCVSGLAKIIYTADCLVGWGPFLGHVKKASPENMFLWNWCRPSWWLIGRTWKNNRTRTQDELKKQTFLWSVCV